jgi:hypothetical protein
MRNPLVFRLTATWTTRNLSCTWREVKYDIWHSVCIYHTCLINNVTQWRPHARKAMELTHNQLFVTSYINAETVNKYAAWKWIPCSAEINAKISIRCWPWCPSDLRRGSAANRLLDCGFESHWVVERAWIPLQSVVCCQVEVSETSRSLVQRNPTDCGDLKTSLARAGLSRQNKKKLAHDTQQR